MVAAATARLVLEAIAETMPRQGHDVVTRVDIRDGWGGAIHVRVHSQLPRGHDDELPGRLRRAVGRALSARHRVDVVWASPG